MSFPSSTPFPIQTFQSSSDASSPAAFQARLLHIIEHDLAEDRQPAKDIDNVAWTTVISGLSDHLLSSFPSSREGSWDALHEKVSLIDCSLEIIHRLLKKITGFFYEQEDLARTLFIRLVYLCAAMDSRDDGDVADAEGIPSPSDLRGKTFVVATHLLRYLGDPPGITRGESLVRPSWELLRTIVDHCLQTCEGEPHTALSSQKS